MSRNAHFLHDRPGTAFEKQLPTSTQESDASIVGLLSPVFKCAQCFGIFPFQFDPKNPLEEITFRKCSFNYVRCIVFLLLGTGYILFHSFSMINSIVHQRNVIDIMAQSLWLQAAFLSFLTTAHLLTQPRALMNLYTKDWRAVEMDCGRAFSSPRLRRFTRACFVFYAGLGIVSIGFVTFHSVTDPDYPAYYLPFIKQGLNPRSITGQNPNYTALELGIQGSVQTLFMIWKWIGMALLDLSLCVYGFTIVETLQTLMVQVNESEKEHDQIVINRSLIPAHCPHRADLEPGDGKTGDVFPSADSITPVMTLPNHSNAFDSDSKLGDAPVSTRETIAMLKLLQKFQKVSQLLNDVNSALGPLLLINYGQLIVMICLLAFLPIKYYQDVNLRLTLLFGGNALVFLGRLILLTICLGDVYPAGINLNMKVAKIMLCQNLDASLLNPILGHLSVFSANPICFNAWGFFPITRGTLLATLSVISTYIVVLLQVKS